MSRYDAAAAMIMCTQAMHAVMQQSLARLGTISIVPLTFSLPASLL